MSAFNVGGLQARASYNFVSALNLVKPDIDNKIFKRYGLQTISGIMDLMGASKGTRDLNYKHFEEDEIMPNIFATNTAADPGVFTIDSTSYVDLADSSPYIETTTLRLFPVRVGDLIMSSISGGGANDVIRGIITSVAPGSNQFTAYRLDGSAWPLVSSAREFIIYSNAHAEGSDQPEPVSSRVIEYSNNLQTIKDTARITGLQDKIQLWTDEGVFTVKTEDDAFIRFMNYVDMGLFLGEALTDTTVADLAQYQGAGESLAMTTGLVPFALGGNVSTYNAINGWTLDDLEDQIDDLNAERAVHEYMLACGINLSGQIDREMGDRYQAGAVQYGAFSGLDAKISVSSVFDSFNVKGYKFYKKTLDAMNHHQLTGATGFDFKSEGILIPMGTKKDARSGEATPFCRKRYLEGANGASREYEVSHFDGLLHHDSGRDIFEVRYKAHVGFEGFGQNNWGYIRKA